jgi:hypothetical protein
MTDDVFSDRFGYQHAPAASEIIREGAPDGIRFALREIARECGINPTPMRAIVCRILLVPPDPNNWSDYPNIWLEVESLLDACEWYFVYDICEAFYAFLSQHMPNNALPFVQRINRAFERLSIGWRLIDGRLEYHGTEGFSEAVGSAVEMAEQSGMQTAASELHEALSDISRRPNPDTTGAVQHSLAALECVAREITGERSATLGRLVQRHLSLPSPLDAAVEKLWGFASNTGRHLEEGRAPAFEDAEFVVSTASAVCTYLVRLHRTRGAGS